MLKGIEKLTLDAGESQTVTFELTERDFSTWDVDAFDWAKCTGDYTARVSLTGANFGWDYNPDVPNDDGVAQQTFADVTRTI
mmetsp:Transcript_12982/g.35083  ORF Transcript_12982/g.35083 Transcript_12982/m.35083 type:complete len:82 (+) Transcript_12982:919-1164(+)